MKYIFTCLFFTIISFSAKSQRRVLYGTVSSESIALPYSTVSIQRLHLSASGDSMGKYIFEEIPEGIYKVVASSVGYLRMEKTISIRKGESILLDFDLSPDISSLDQVVVTGTRTPKRRTTSPVIVNLISSKTLDHVVASSLSEGLRYQPGLRVETDCQTCNYSQLRINGLQGGYSQILINSRQIFSPLMGLYGMEQIPANMIDRIEVVRGGVSALYGSSAIGGTVNVITKIPTANSYNVTNTFQRIDRQTSDNFITGNMSLVNKARNIGVGVFVNHRRRGLYDTNGDNFSELPQLKDNTFGTNFYCKPAANQRLELSFSSINEYRFGGEHVKKPAYLALQSEERTHNILMGSVDYSISFNENKNSISIYYGGQKTDRKHYTGVIPDDSVAMKAFFANPPYGTSDVVTHQAGVQLNNRLDKFLRGKAVLTAGAEYVFDAVFDEISAYQYKIEQKTKNIGVFVQQDWDVTPKINFLAGFRVDKHNLVNHAVFSPRVSLLYKFNKRTQFRLGWGTGFRAPQAFDTDLHIAFAAGGVSRISLANGLKEERSNSFTGSINYDKASEHLIAGFTIECFYTHLKDAFFQFPLGVDNFGNIFEKRNGKGAAVKGITLESRVNFDYVVQMEAGFTVQSSRFDAAVQNIDGLPAKKEFLRTPNNYGYATITYSPTKNWNISANGVYTGSMLLAHFAGKETGQLVDEYFTAKAFFDLGIRLSHVCKFKKMKTGLEIFGGFKNIFNSYQKNFDIGKNRDSNFIYGPNMPRTVFLGLKVKSF